MFWSPGGSSYVASRLAADESHDVVTSPQNDLIVSILTNQDLLTMTLGCGPEINRKDQHEDKSGLAGLTGLTTVMVGQTRLNAAPATVINCLDEVS